MDAQSENGVAIIVVNYNGQAYLQRCLAALAEQTVAPQQIIVVDNASDDNSITLAKQVFPKVSYIDAGSNLGFAAANNLAARHLDNDIKWLALINPDAFAQPDWLDELLTTAHAKPDLAFFSSELIDAADPSLLDGSGDCYHVSGLVWRRSHAEPVNKQSQLPWFAPCAAAALYRRDAFEQVGGFDESFFCYIEDVDLGFRLRIAGYEGEHVTASKVRHVGSGITARESDFSIYHGHRNLVWTYVKNMPRSWFWRYLPQHLLMNVVALLYYSLRGRPGIIFKAKWHALKGLAAHWRARESIHVNAQYDPESLRTSMTDGWLTPYIGRNR